MVDFNIKNYKDNRGIATDEEMHRFLESMDFRIAYEERPGMGAALDGKIHNIVLYFTPFTGKYLNYVKRYGQYQGANGYRGRRKRYFKARSICMGLMIAKPRALQDAHMCNRRSYVYSKDAPSSEWLQHELEGLNLHGKKIYANTSELGPTYYKCPSTYKAFKSFTHKYIARESDRSKTGVISGVTDKYYIKKPGWFDSVEKPLYGDYHMRVYSKKTLIKGGETITNQLKAKKENDKIISVSNKPFWSAKPMGKKNNYINKGFYINLTPHDAARGFVVFLDVDRICTVAVNGISYYKINFKSDKRIIGFIDHMISVPYKAQAGGAYNNYLCKIVTKNRIEGKLHKSNYNEIYDEVSSNYLINQ